ncbi:DUF2878 domain-containing protein [uncultured Marinobacter sp.]|uniref:DUF2878 domain-containing protein n=1 Tax=uncultured Marinobacter sp. TaxID=187379 RepID=UPI0030D6F9B5
MTTLALTGTGAGKLVNFVLFQLGWLALVTWPGVASTTLAVALVAFHLSLVSRAWQAELRFIVVGTVIGSLLDGLWFQTGILTDQSGSLWTPYWLMAVWAMFLTTLGHSLAWMHQKPWLPWLLAPLSGPFAYWAASRLGAIGLEQGGISLLALAIGWMLVFPLLLLLQRRFFAETLE